jgi:hypothetical protein
MTPDTLSRLRQTDPYDFEHFVADVWSERGWETTVSQGSNDMGVDVVAEKHDGLVDTKQVIQAKRYAEGNTVGRPKIQQYHTLKEQDSEADAAVVVTTSSFTSTAEEWAAEHNVKLVDGDDLVDIINDGNLDSVVDKYAPTLSELESAEAKSTDTGGDTATQTGQSASSGGTIGQRTGRRVALLWLLQIAGMTLAVAPDLLAVVSVNMAVGAFGVGLFGTTLAVFADARALHKGGASYKPNRLLWPAGVFMIPVFGGAWYLWRRLKS